MIKASSEQVGYEIFTPPFALDFPTWSRKQAREYFEWFLAVRAARINQLERDARRDAPDVTLDFSPDSLYDVGEYLIATTRGRNRSRDEIQNIAGELPREVQAVADFSSTLDTGTVSRCIDVGIYLAETLRSVHPILEWKLWTRRTVEFNRPVVVPFNKGKVPLDPTGVVTNVAFGALRGKQHLNRLRELYDVWAEKVG